MMKRTKYIIALLTMFAIAACSPSPEPDSPGNSGGGTSGGGGGSTQTPQTYTQSVTFPAKGGEQVVTLSNLTSSVSSVESTPNWLIISPQNYTYGAPTLKLELQENMDTTERSCKVNVLASSGDKVVLTIVQQAAEVKTGIDDIHNTHTDQPAYSPSL